MFTVKISEPAFGDLAELSVATQRRVLDETEDALEVEPLAPTRHRKPLDPKDTPLWEHEPPVWELRVGDVRVFYDVDQKARIVHVRAIRKKGRKLTKELL
jgi:mRNA-degrading endonuclease RelE of RelBE toxin-antitoxin system